MQIRQEFQLLISTTMALATPSIASSMYTAVRLSVSPTRVVLTGMGMLGGSEVAGRYAEAEVYEQIFTEPSALLNQGKANYISSHARQHVAGGYRRIFVLLKK